GRPLQTLRGHARALTGLAISPDGQLLASSSEDATVRIWTSELVRLSRVPAGKFSVQDLAEAQDALADTGLSAAERAALEFIVALVRWRRRFDIQLDDSPRRVEVGEFDIILAGGAANAAGPRAAHGAGIGGEGRGTRRRAGARSRSPPR